MSSLAVVVPAGVDDPARPSGGNSYDLRLCAELGAMGFEVVRHDVAGDWPTPTRAALAALDRLLGEFPTGAKVLIDGLIALAAGEVLAAHADRLALTSLVHMPLPEEHRASEAAALAACRAVIVTSDWSRDELLHRHPGLSARDVVVATPGADDAELSRPLSAGSRLLTVGAIAAIKGHDLIVAALAECADLVWTWDVVGSPEIEPDFVAGLRRAVADAGLSERVRFHGARSAADLTGAYARADLLILGSRVEAYGMVITEALARGVPVLATRVGGVAQAIGTADGELAGFLVQPSAASLAAGVREWLTDPVARSGARAAAQRRRTCLTPWATTARICARALCPECSEVA